MFDKSPLETAKQTEYPSQVIEMTEQILQAIKKSKPTYEQAYVSLRLAREQLEYESNFVQVFEG